MKDVLQKQMVLDFLKQHSLATLSTYNAKTKRPQAALVTYAENENLELFFGTFKNTRKYINLQTHPYVALVIGWDDTMQSTLQYEGKAVELSAKASEKARECFLAKEKNLNSEEFLYHPLYRFFRVNPLWMRYSSYTKFEVLF